MFWKVRATLASRVIRKVGAGAPAGRPRPLRVASSVIDALGRLVEAGDAVEHGGLAGAVGADQRGDVAAPGLEGEVVDGDQAAEAHGQVLDLEQRVSERGDVRTRALISRGPPSRADDDTALRSFRKAVGSRVRDEAARLPDHDQHHGEAEQQHAVLRGVEVSPKICLRKSSSRRISVPPTMTIGGDDDADQAAHAAEHDDGEDDAPIR